MTRSSRHTEADYTPSDMGPPERRLSFEEKQLIAELKNDWEHGISNELLWAEVNATL